MPLLQVEPRGPRQAPPKLTGPIRTRAEARIVYSNIVRELHACDDQDTLEIYLMTVGEELIQFQDELEFLWNGDDDDFPGLDKEIKAAWNRVAIIY